MPAKLHELIDYYLECLKKERRDDLAQRENELTRYVVATSSSFHSSWNALSNDPAGKEVVDRIGGRDDLAAVYVPVVAVDASGKRFTPVAGLFCSLRGGRPRPDSSDIWVGPTLDGDLSEEDKNGLRDELERASAESPKALLEAILGRMRASSIPDPGSCASLDELKQLPQDTTAVFPSFWLVEVHATYDRGLVNELVKLREIVGIGGAWRQTSLKFLLDPPDADAPNEPALWKAFANPANLTFSQAYALASCSQPLTVITGPPGTGKTRLVTALIIEHLLSGRSLLLSSKINMAVDSAAELTERLLGRGAVLRTGNQEARLQLVETSSWLSGQSCWPAGGELLENTSAVTPSLYNEETKNGGNDQPLQSNVSRIKSLSKKLQRHVDMELHWWQWLTKARLAAFEREWNRVLQESHRQFTSLPVKMSELASLLRQRLDAMVRSSQTRLNRLPNALDGDAGSRRRAFGHLAENGWPIAVTNLTLSTNIPFEPGVFDTVVVDEASTCDPASLLPLMYRAKRMVIVGDDRQLPHITGQGWRQVSPVPSVLGRDGEFAASFDTSAFHLCSQLLGDANRLLLSEHFRCPPAIISFSNTEFYGGSLRIQTEERQDSVEIRQVSGEQKTTRTGSRINESQLAEGIAVLATLADKYPHGRLGLVTPYRAMSDAAIRAAEHDARLSERLAANSLIIGTAHRFQGNEVDCLVFVTVAGKNASDRDLRWVEERKLFNVAVTRTRQKLVVIVDADLWRRGMLPLTRRLSEASAVMVTGGIAQCRELIHDISDELGSLKLTCRTGCSFRGYPLDIMENSDPPSWAVRLHTWDELNSLTPAGVMRIRSEQSSLNRWSVRILNVNQLNARSVVSRWAAERELTDDLT